LANAAQKNATMMMTHRTDQLRLGDVPPADAEQLLEVEVV